MPYREGDIPIDLKEMREGVRLGDILGKGIQAEGTVGAKALRKKHSWPV